MKKIIRLVGRPRIRKFTVRINDEHPYKIEVHVARTRNQMLHRMINDGIGEDTSSDVMGTCISSASRFGRGALGRPANTIATIYLNTADLRKNGGSMIVSHECTHAALAYLRIRHIDAVSAMKDEETLAYAVGDMTRAVINGCYSAGVWGD